MKRFMMTAATAALITTGAMAQGVSQPMLENVEAAMDLRGIDVPVSTLSDEQIVQIYLLTANGDMTAGVTDQRILAIIEQEADSAAVVDAMDEETMMLREERRAMMVMGTEDSVTISVQNFLDANGYDVDASTLDDAVVAEIYFAAFSANTTPTDAEIDVLLAS